MKPSRICKDVGLKSLNELSELSGQSVQTLNGWHKNKPDLFKKVLVGSLMQKAMNVINK